MVNTVKITYILFLTILISQTSQAQKKDSIKIDSVRATRAQDIFVEFAGPGLYFSANYDTRFSKQKAGLGGRIGFGFIADNGSSFTSVPVQVNYLLGKQGKYFEIGIGATYVYFKDASNVSSDVIYFNRIYGGSSTVLGTMTFGYRYQPADGGFSFRAGFSPLFNSSSFEPYAGLSFGYAFK